MLRIWDEDMQGITFETNEWTANNGEKTKTTYKVYNGTIYG